MKKKIYVPFYMHDDENISSQSRFKNKKLMLKVYNNQEDYLENMMVKNRSSFFVRDTFGDYFVVRGVIKGKLSPF